MVKYFKNAVPFYKWTAVIFIIVYTIYIIYDDYVFIEKISSFTDLGLFLGFQLLYLAIYVIIFSFYFWLIATFAILAYRMVKEKGISKTD